MEGSFVSKAKIAIHSAAAKAEKVFTDIKKSDSRDLDNRSLKESKSEAPLDPDTSKDCHEGKKNKVRPKPIKAKQDWHERLRNIRLGKKGPEDFEKPGNPTMAYAIFDDNLYFMGEREFTPSKDSEDEQIVEGSNALSTDIIPSSAIVKQLAVAIETGLNHNSMKDLLASSRGSSPVRERASMGLSAMKSLVLREKEDKLTNEYGSDEKVLSVINTLLNIEGCLPGRTVSGLIEQTNAASLMKDIHGAPIESFVAKLAEAMGCLRSLRKMALFWFRVVDEMKRLWCDGQYIPGIPKDAIPDLNSCLLYQQLQVINCCISRKKRHITALESVESVEVSSTSEGTLPMEPCVYAKTKSGELVLRIGADKECDNLTMLETGEPVYSPVMQEPPLLTEDLIKETEEFILRTGSLGAGCSQLISDMQAFKAANPGCILADFVRWHSPPDWMECDSSPGNDTSDTGDLSVKGQLSMRMQKEGNLWRELWETAKPVPAARQSPLYDEDLAVEGILDHLDDASPSNLFQQLFLAVLGSGLVIAEATLSTNSGLSKLFNECKNYIVSTCQGKIWVEKLDDICQIYETMETMLLNPDEFIKIAFQTEETTATGEPRNRFKRLGLIFRGKNRNPSKTSSKTNDENPLLQPFSSIFSKKPPRPSPSPSPSPSPLPSDKPSSLVDNDWTLV